MNPSKIEISPSANKREDINLHPHQLLLYLGLFGSGVLFLFVLIAYFATKSPTAVLPVSRFFAFSTSILLFSSYPIARLTGSFTRERPAQIIKSLAVASFSGALFILLQVIGWYDMQETGFSISNRASGFLYVLSGLHILHIVAMVLITAWVMYRTAKKISNPIYSLVYFTNPYEQLKLRMLSQAWFFLHFVWVLIYLSFVALN